MSDPISSCPVEFPSLLLISVFINNSLSSHLFFWLIDFLGEMTSRLLRVSLTGIVFYNQRLEDHVENQAVIDDQIFSLMEKISDM